MAESMNTVCDIAVSGIAYVRMNNYGKIMVGDKAFEFYNDRNVNDYIQIPWEEITYIVADVVMGGKWIPRFEIQTRKNGSYRFAASRNTKAVLRACRKYVDPNHMVKALSVSEKVSRSAKGLFHRKKS